MMKFVTIFCCIISSCAAFTSSGSRPRIKNFILSADTGGTDSEPFLSALRDLQADGVPLLECDADQVHTLQAALWTTMSDMSKNISEEKSCLIFDKIPTAALQAFADDFLILKSQVDQMEYLPELSRFTISLLGKGSLGPAIVLDIARKTDIESTTQDAKNGNLHVDKEKYSTAMKSFMERVVVGNSDGIFFGLGDEGSAAPIKYQTSPSNNVCTILSAFWGCVCEMMSQSDDKIGTYCLQMPTIGPDNIQRFAVVSQLLSRSLCLYRGDSVFTLVHFHPQYDRSKFDPIDKPAYGHLPPISWLKPMLKANGDATDTIEDKCLQNVNFLRRSPIPAINIVRNSLLIPPKIANIELDNGMMVQVSALDDYCPNISKLIVTDKNILEALQNEEIALLGGSEDEKIF